MELKKISSFLLNEKFSRLSGLSGLSGLMPNYEERRRDHRRGHGGGHTNLRRGSWVTCRERQADNNAKINK